jgi:predicted dehydrogenase
MSQGSGKEQALRVAVVGCGAIAESHLQFLRSADGAELVALVDVSAVVVEHLAGLHGPGVQAFTDAATMAAAVEPDVVHVLTPPATHVAIARAMLGAGAHVICEKPLAGTAVEVDELLTFAHERSRILLECQNYRFLGEVAWLQAHLRSLGQVRTVEIDIRVPIAAGGRFVDDAMPHHTSHLPGGAIRDFLPHMVYLAEHLVPMLPIELVGVNWALRSGKHALGCDSMTGVLSGEELDLVLKFSALGSPPTCAIDVVGELGMAHVDLFHRHRRIETRGVGGPLAAVIDRARGAQQAAVDAVQEVRSKVLDAGQNGMSAMLTAFYAGLSEGTAVIRPAQLRRTAQVVDALVAEAPR